MALRSPSWGLGLEPILILSVRADRALLAAPALGW